MLGRFSATDSMKNDKKIPAPEDAVQNFDPNSDLPPDADVEERFNDFWKKNGPFIFGLIAAMALVVVGMETWKYLQQRGEETRATEYGLLENPAAKLEFAKNHADTKTGGIAFLEVADSDYAEGNFDTAAEHYAAAQEALAETPIAGRARLGATLSKLRAGQAGALNDLEMLARDPGVLAPYRGEAAYLLAEAQWEAGSLDEVRRALDLLATIEEAPAWQSMGRQLESSVPGLEEVSNEDAAPEGDLKLGS
jgi:hypothetical protein